MRKKNRQVLIGLGAAVVLGVGIGYPARYLASRPQDNEPVVNPPVPDTQVEEALSAEEAAHPFLDQMPVPEEAFVTAQPPSPGEIETRSFEAKVIAISPWRAANLAFVNTGRVSAVNVQEGQSVSEGQLLASQDSSVFLGQIGSLTFEKEAALKKASDANTVAFLEKKEKFHGVQYGRSKRLYEDSRAVPLNAVESAELLKIEAQYGKGSAQIEQEVQRLLVRSIEEKINTAKAEIELQKIIAPFPGEIVKVHASVGETFEKEVAIEIADYTVMKIAVGIPLSVLRDNSWWESPTTEIVLENKVTGETFACRYKGYESAESGGEQILYLEVDNPTQNYRRPILPANAEEFSVRFVEGTSSGPAMAYAGNY